MRPELRDLANQIVTASAALSGLIVVFLGAILTSYDQFTTAEKGVVKSAYRFRAWMGLSGLVLSLIGGVMAVIASVCSETVWLVAAVLAMGLSLFLLLIMAAVAVWEV